MKTSITISDPWFEAAREAARQRGTTLRALVEVGLRQVLERQSVDRPEFRLRKAGFAGKGLHAGARSMDWDELRELAYGDRSR